jgi:hypothetical protein
MARELKYMVFSLIENNHRVSALFLEPGALIAIPQLIEYLIVIVLG